MTSLFSHSHKLKGRFSSIKPSERWTFQYICPEGKTLTSYAKTKQDGRELMIYSWTGCNGRPVKCKCTKAQARTITRDGREPLQDKMREKLRREEGKKIYQMRSYTVDPIFGNMKLNTRLKVMRSEATNFLVLKFRFWG